MTVRQSFDELRKRLPRAQSGEPGAAANAVAPGRQKGPFAVVGRAGCAVCVPGSTRKASRGPGWPDELPSPGPGAAHVTGGNGSRAREAADSVCRAVWGHGRPRSARS